MKKIYIKCALFLFVMVLSNVSKIGAQPGRGISYRFAAGPAPAAFPTVGQLLTNSPVGNQDDYVINLPIGGNVKFAGVSYSNMILSTNGWMALAPNGAIPPALATSLPTNQLSTYVGGLPIIAPFWDDILTIGFQTNFTAGELWVKWTSKIDKSNPTQFGLFWVRINTTTGVIRYYYTASAYTFTQPVTASIGMAGVCPGDFYSYNFTTPPAYGLDSITETSDISTRPTAATFTFTPYQVSDDCASAQDLGSVTGSCTNTSINITNAITSGSPMCSTTDVADVWFKIVKPIGVSNVKFTTSPFAGCQPVAGTSIEVFASCGGSSLGCASSNFGANPTFAEITLSRAPCVAETLYVRVTSDLDLGGKFNICITDDGTAGTPGSNCGSPTWICGFPYTSPGGSTTAGFGDEIDSVSSACHSSFMDGEDYVYAYTATATKCVNVVLTSAGNNPAVFVTRGCPTSIGSVCLASAQIVTGTGTINAVSLEAGQTYYFIVDNNPISGNTNIPFSISISDVGSPPAGDNCAAPGNLGLVTPGTSCATSTTTWTTACSTPTIGNPGAVPTSCVTTLPIASFNEGVTGDIWLKFTATYTGPLQINTTPGTVNPTTNAAMAVYTGTCGAFGPPIACDANSGAGGMPSLSISVVNTVTYYIRVWSEHPDNEGSFNICFQSNCGPVNDLPCNATFVPMGGFANGFNTCATDSAPLEPGNAAQCVSGGGTINTVWYKTTVPPSGLVNVRVINGSGPGALTDREMQGFYFTNGCANAATVATTVRLTCNHVGTGCGSFPVNYSDFVYSGTPGADLYIAVDGIGSQTGTFTISFVDGSNVVIPPVAVQDCGAAQVVCSTANITVPEPGYVGIGNVCDLNSTIADQNGNTCFGGTERHSSWYQFTVDPALSGGTATISFDVITLPTAALSLALWDVTNFSDPCDSILKTARADRCTQNNVSGNDSSGLSPTGTSGALDSYAPSFSFSGPPRNFILLFIGHPLVPTIPNGYSIRWGTTPIASATTVFWEGATDTTFHTLTNWGVCGPAPACGINARINFTANGRQPTVSGTRQVKDLLISAGATLRILGGATLQVCGSFTNNGNLICMPGSTVEFIGDSTQIINGSLTGANSFANLKITKAASSGIVQLLTDIDVTENFTTSNATSIFNIYGKYMKLGGNFLNASGTTTFTGIGGSILEFYLSGMQNFTNNLLPVNLNRVVMNKPAGRVNLTGGVTSIMNIDSILTLTSGIISTRSFGGLEVNMKYNLPAAITGQNALSYIDGKLRRKISNGPPVSGSYAFPVGNILSPGGYNRAVINFTTTTTMTDLLATFTNWAPPPGPDTAECVVADYSVLNMFNNGYWTFTKGSAPFTGNYNITLHNRGYTNNTGNGWTVAKANIASNPLLQPSWDLLGVCVIPSIPDSVKRDIINPGPSAATSFNHHYATAQTPLKLPIELLYFTAEPKGEEVLCSWATASETNNQYFEVERSTDGYEYGTIDKIAGYGNGISSETRKYSSLDKDLCEDIRYYRLKQVDINGDFSYSKPIAINCRRTSGIELYPNPANTFIKYQFYYPVSTELTVKITDISGRIVRSEKINVQKGINLITSSIQDLAAGVYNLKIDALEKGNIMLQKQFFKD